MKKPEFIFLFKSFSLWRIFLIFFAILAVKFIPLQRNFLGGGMANYLSSPLLWSLSNFDGEHYLAIAHEGYRPLTYFFFPMYPLLINLISGIFGKSVISYLISGIFVSHASLLIGMIGFYKLMGLDYERKISKLGLILLFLFPTSFYFGSVYTESLFFAFSVWSFFAARKRNWVAAGILGAFATATRVIGLAVVVGLFIEWWQYMRTTQDRRKIFLPLISVLISFLGIGIYLYYLYIRTGDPFNFLTTVNIFGSQRSASLILLPQVFYRYIFKILPSLNYTNFIVYFTPWLEFIIALLFTSLAIFSFFKLRLSYSIYLLLGFLIPAFSGSFSSLPRYVLVLFPAFILGGIYLNKIGRWQYLIFVVLGITLFICTSFFARGNWIS